MPTWYWDSALWPDSNSQWISMYNPWWENYVMYHRSTSGLLDKQSLVPQDNAAKGSRQNSWVTLENSVAPKTEVAFRHWDLWNCGKLVRIKQGCRICPAFRMMEWTWKVSSSIQPNWVDGTVPRLFFYDWYLLDTPPLPRLICPYTGLYLNGVRV